MRAVILSLFAALALSCAALTTPVAEAKPVPRDVVAELTDKTVALVSPTADGGARAYCTGVWVSPNEILTAAHCVDDVLPLLEPVSYVVRSDVYESGSASQRAAIAPRTAFLVDLDPDVDLALLAVLAPPRHLSARLASGPIVQGAPVQAMGHSIGLFWSYSQGHVAAVRKGVIRNDAFVWIQTTTPISPGNSGGGLFNANGDLLGICTATFTYGQNLNIFVHRSHVEAFLRANNV
jgi:S1-C subfamily serine protease